MNLEVSKSHTIDYLKRTAKKLKKEKNISHVEALNEVSKTLGFQNWKHLLNSKSDLIKLEVPNPSIIYLRNNRARPNRKLPIETHAKIGDLIKELLPISFMRRSVNKPLNELRSILDDWVASEYPSLEDLPNDIFFGLYYRDHRKACLDKKISIENYEKFLRISKELDELLRTSYHECRPLEMILNKLKQAVTACNRWKQSSERSSNIKEPTNSRVKRISMGKMIRLKDTKECGLVLNHDLNTNVITYFSHRGNGMAADHEVTLLRDQPSGRFLPMRKYLPYGIECYKDGSEVLFNRDYEHMWLKRPSGEVIKLKERHKSDGAEMKYLFNDGNPPWYSKDTLDKCNKLLKDWGIEGKFPVPLEDKLKEFERMFK